MKLFHLSTYKFYRPGENGLKIFIASDLHFSYQVKNEKLRALVNFAKRCEPNYILIPGDLIDSNDMLERGGERMRLLNFLEKLSAVAPVLISFGNHDFYKASGEKSRKSSGWKITKNSTFHDDLRALENVHLLDNEAFEDHEIYVYGHTLSPAYYNFSANAKRTTIFNPTHEKVDELLKELDDVDQGLITHLPKNKLKIAMLHSPVCLNDYRVKSELAEFDYFVSGHMHNGAVPPVIDELWFGNRGLITPTRNFFAPSIRNTIKSTQDKSIVVGAVTTFHECAGFLHNANVLYPAYVGLLVFSNDRKYARKPDVVKKYYEW